MLAWPKGQAGNYPRPPLLRPSNRLSAFGRLFTRGFAGLTRDDQKIHRTSVIRCPTRDTTRNSLRHLPHLKGLPMIVHAPLPRSGSPEPSDSTSLVDRDLDSSRDSRDSCGEGDPFRQLFHRHANHLNSAQTHHMKAGLRSRLFAEKSEL